MIVPAFMRFYGYSVSDTLNEFTRTFYSLVNSMYSIQATETLRQAMASNPTAETIEGLRKQERGIAGTVEEVRTAKRVKNDN